MPNELVSDITTFNEEFAETLDILHTKRTPTYLCGDSNIDLLKIHQKPNYCTFYDNLISSGYLPRISLPTRLTDHSATLIDKIFSTVGIGRFITNQQNIYRVTPVHYLQKAEKKT